MINREEKKLEKIKESCKDKIIDNEKYQSENLTKKNFITLLEAQVRESEEKILEKTIETEKEIIVVYDRLSKEIERSQKFSLEKLILDFLPISDNIERALNIIETSKLNKNFIEISNKLKSFCNLLRDFFLLFNVKKINDINVSFNPSIHQAMSIHYTDKIEPNQIVTVMQPGYILHESRLLRPAMVIVSKKNV